MVGSIRVAEDGHRFDVFRSRPEQSMQIRRELVTIGPGASPPEEPRINPMQIGEGRDDSVGNGLVAGSTRLMY
jgi:hypothetical protein